MESILLFSFILFIITSIGGLLPVIKRNISDNGIKYLLAFSGAFLLGVTLVHLVPETVEHLHHQAGIWILLGFFLQQFFQKYTHGMEHGHVHSHHEHHISVLPIFIGLSIHALSEGIPLGVTYQDTHTTSSLFLAIALHKLPEAMLISSLVLSNGGSKQKAVIVALLFAMITPFAALLSYYLGSHFSIIQDVLKYCIPIIAGVFIHIATTIFFESGTKAHEMNFKKWLVIILGVGLSIMSLLFE